MKKYTFAKVWGREVLDSRGNPTVEVEVTLDGGGWGRAIVPSGASKGQHEALELRDGDKKRFRGKGVTRAVNAVNTTISQALVKHAFSRVQEVDGLLIDLDGTPQKSKLGANSILAVSMAFVQAVANQEKTPLYRTIAEMMGTSERLFSLPVPLMNILNGGLHANNGLEIQEFMIVPHGFPTFSEALRAGTEVFQELKEKLHDKHLSIAVGDEGGFAPSLESNTKALEIIAAAVEGAGYQLGKQVSLALDVASSSFYDADKKAYRFRWKKETLICAEALTEFYESVMAKFPIVSIEDGLDENDWAGWKTLTSRLGKKVQLVGDDVFVTQVAKVKQGISQGVANAVLVKVNQVGSLKETFETLTLCRESGYHAVTSHRSGETEDVTIAHLAVGSGCGQIKTGSLSRSERTAKYNELLRIEEAARLAGSPLPFARVF